MKNFSLDENGNLHGYFFQYHLSTNTIKYIAIFHHGRLICKVSFDEYGKITF